MHRSFILLCCSAVLMACSSNPKGGAEEVAYIDTIPYMLQHIQECSRLYTAEYQVRKIVTHSDTTRLNVSLPIIGSKLGSIKVPASDRKVAIPINATLKAFIDFSKVTEEDVIRRDDGKIEIRLPQPEVMLTSSSIDHDGVRDHVSLFGRDFSDAELSGYEKRGRQAIINDIPKIGIVSVARSSAAKMLIPLIARVGLNQEDVIITFADEKPKIVNMIKH